MNFFLASIQWILDPTHYGGANGMGTIFRYDVSTSTLTTLFSFGTNASYPHALILGRDGQLYGTAGLNSGALFRFDPATAAFTIPEFVSEPRDLGEIARIVIAACERWENRQGVGG